MEKFLALRRNYLAAEVHTSVEEANQAPDINIRSQRSMDTVEQYIDFCRHNTGKPPTHLRFPKEKLPRSRWSEQFTSSRQGCRWMTIAPSSY
jgi:hypothetical protein